jgi:hypothetical protein
VVGLPRILTGRRAALLYQILRLERPAAKAGSERGLPGPLATRLGLSRLKSIKSVEELFTNSLVRLERLTSFTLQPQRSVEEIEQRYCLELLILHDYFRLAESDYCNVKLDRRLLEHALKQHAHGAVAIEFLDAAINRTTHAVRGFWMLWLEIQPELVRWEALDTPGRERAKLGLFVLTTICESVDPVRMAELFVPELDQEFNDMRTEHGNYRTAQELLAAERHAAVVQEAASSVRPEVDGEFDFPALRSSGEEGTRSTREAVLDEPDFAPGISAAQMLARLREEVARRGAQWLRPALQAVKEAWRMPDAGKAAKRDRERTLGDIIAQLERHDELEPAAQTALQPEIIAAVTRGFPFSADGGEEEEDDAAGDQDDKARDQGKDKGNSSSNSNGTGKDNKPAAPRSPSMAAPTPRPSRTARDLNLAAAANAFLQGKPASHRSDLLWTLAGHRQLLCAYWCAQAWCTDAGYSDLPAAELFKGAALAPFVFDDHGAAAAAYHDTLRALNLEETEWLFERHKTPGFYALGLAVSLQPALFCPASGAPRLLRLSNHGFSPELSQLLNLIASVGEQAISCTLGDFRSECAKDEEDSAYRADRVRPIVAGVIEHLPRAVEMLKAAAQDAATLDDAVGLFAAAAACESLNAVLRGARRTLWENDELTEWLLLPRRVLGDCGERQFPTALCQAIGQATSDWSYIALARSAIASSHFSRAQALLYEMGRIGADEHSIRDLRAFTDKRRRLLRDVSGRLEALRSELSEALRARWITPDESRQYSEQLAALATAAAPQDYAAQLIRLNAIGKTLDGHRRARLSEAQQADATELKHRVLEDKRGKDGDRIRTTLSPLTAHAERLIAAACGAVAPGRFDGARGPGEEGTPNSLGDAEAIPFISLIFGVPAAGIEHLSRALESVPLPESKAGAGRRNRVVYLDKVRSLYGLAQSTRELAVDRTEPQILLLEMPAPADDPGLQAEILQYLYALRPRFVRGSLRVVLTFGSAATWQWIVTGTELESHMVTVHLAPWCPSALRSLLSEQHLPDSTADVRLWEQQTGGWHLLLQSRLRALHSSAEAAVLQDKDSVPSLDAEGARRTLRTFGLFDVPPAQAIFSDLVRLELHAGFDREMLDLVLSDQPAYADVPCDVFVEWGLRLGLLRSETGQLALDATVAHLIERAGLETETRDAQTPPKDAVAHHDWVSKEVERIGTTATAQRLFVEQWPVRLDGEPYFIGPRMTEAYALFIRAVLSGVGLCWFGPTPTLDDLWGAPISLYFVWRDLLAGRCAPGRWATPALVRKRRDIWILGGVSRLRDGFLDRVKIENRPFTDKMRCHWYTEPAAGPTFAGGGEPGLPGVYVFGADAVLEGTLAVALKGVPPPLAVIIDANGMSRSDELARQVHRLHHLSEHAPILVLGAIGDHVAIGEVSDAGMPVWQLRAGDAARLNQLEHEHAYHLTSVVSSRGTGADLASAYLTNGVSVELEVLEGPATRRWLNPLFQAVERLEAAASQQQALLNDAHNLVRALLSLSVPWKMHSEAAAASPGVGRYAPLSLAMRVNALRARIPATSTQQSMVALKTLVQRAEVVCEVLRSPQCVTGKQAALLAAATKAHDAGEPLCIVCHNRPAKRAVEAFLADKIVNVLRGSVKVMTYGQVRRAIFTGQQTPPPTLLVLDALAFGSHWYFSGIARRVRLICYGLEREFLDRRLRGIARDIHSTSAERGDKRAWIVGAYRRGQYLDALARHMQGEAREATSGGAVSAAVQDVMKRGSSWVPTDRGVNDMPPCWDFQPSDRLDQAVLPLQSAAVDSDADSEPIVLPEGWLERALQRAAETCDEFTDDTSEDNSDADTQEFAESDSGHGAARVLRNAPGRGGARIAVALADGHPPALLAPGSSLLLLRNTPEDIASGTGFGDLEGTGEGIILATEVRVGQMVLIPRRGSVRALLKRLLERFNTSADYLTASPFQQRWEDSVTSLALLTHGSSAAALALLIEHGVAVTTAQAVQAWFDGVVLGPRDVASIRAVGLVLERAELSEYAELTHAAQAYIRSVHRGLGRVLVEILLAVNWRSTDVVQHKGLRLRRADLEEVSRIGQVTQISDVPPERCECG